MIAYESDSLPADYRGALLVDLVGRPSHRTFSAEPRGASFRGRRASRSSRAARTSGRSASRWRRTARSSSATGYQVVRPARQGAGLAHPAKDKKPAARSTDPIAAMHSADRAVARSGGATGDRRQSGTSSAPADGSGRFVDRRAGAVRSPCSCRRGRYQARSQSGPRRPGGRRPHGRPPLALSTARRSAWIEQLK